MSSDCTTGFPQFGHGARCCLPVSNTPQEKAQAGAGAAGRVSALDEFLEIENVAFSGGGNRCFWQAGFWSVASEELSLKPEQVSGVSAGAAIACALFSGGFNNGFQCFKQSVAENDTNINIRNLLQDRPVFPHGKMYRHAILSSISPLALKRLHTKGPEIYVMVACPPAWASPGMALVLAMIANGIESCFFDDVHATAGRHVGFVPDFISVRECETPEALADLIIASSCIPPLTPQARRKGVALLDGCLVDNVPTGILTAARGNTLVLLSRQFKQLPLIPGKIYVQPSQAIPAATLDYTNEAALQSTFDLGRRDADAFCASVKSSQPLLIG